jgi:hypothetical protein
MVPITLDPEASSSDRMSPAYDQWISTTADPGLSRFAPLCYFDVAVSVELHRVAALEQNWDAQGAYPVTPSIIQAARRLISSLPSGIKNREGATPAVVPLRKGNLQFEWHKGPKTLELEIENPSTIHYLKFHPEAGIEEEDCCDITDTKTLAELIRWFVEG